MEDTSTTIIPTEAILALSRTHPLFQSGNITLGEEAAALIANTVEFKMKQIIQTAQRFMIKSCRYVENGPTLLPNDVRDALRTLKMDNIDGYNNCYDYRYVISSKLYKGNRVVKRESALKSGMDERCWGRQKLTDVVTKDMQKAIPAQPALTVHWTLINEEVPALASNMAQCITERFKQVAKKQIIQMAVEDINVLNAQDTARQLASVGKLLTNIKLPMTIDTLSYENNIERAILDALQKHITNVTERNTDDKNGKQTAITIPKVEHILTKEQRFFLKEIKNTVKKASTTMDHQVHVQLGKVLSILRKSPALDQLLPELAAFFVAELEQPTGDVEAILKFAEAITSNTKIQIHYHIHQLVAPLLKLMLKQDDKEDIQAINRNLSFRKLAAKTVGNLARALRESNTGLEGIDQYLMKLYKKTILDPKCSITMLYGAMCGIEQLPLTAKRILYFPMVPLLLNILFKKHRQAHRQYAKTGLKLEEFKSFTCQEIVHMALVILYEACYEDIVQCIHETANFNMSCEAQLMIKETLDGYACKAVNPENFIPIYNAIIARCFETLKPQEIVEHKKKEYKTLPEIEHALQYYQFYKSERTKKRQRVEEIPQTTETDYRSPLEQMTTAWYIGQATHALTLTI
ncbi:TATA box binding protein associated factor (TAF) family protein [Babesia bovis T2Bo]|uniref:TATA box binding protein associated factor (TAF) histone-like fold domain-containing protein n=1 Tax=Babesia bovis TaxID=5865 RepID=A7AMC5_BABBO|nr:TATA box binding protein associated factor (TAF) family protein [Babesia bovis T2Bo]EDO07709.1 TATA box binding protein associated factor (TAF) family protein [Babesia bovis T2Bo]|eukprot:XP_001611277.1 hypothetical protein [Babesia bovis T2Bo]